MNVLGIETSCDETSVAVVKNGKYLLSNVVVSSLKEHSKYGGVIPEIASRRQLECISAVSDKALEDAHVKLSNIDAVAVTSSPGLIGSLLVGLSFSRALSFALKKPVVDVNHIKAHLYANFLTTDLDKKDFPKLPAIGLIVSGGHTSLYHVKNWHEFKLLGQTRDDAAGEAFDKVARILNLGYPGGPAIEHKAKECTQSNLRFTCAPLAGTLDFSFSGIKTAVLYHYRDHHKEKNFSIAEVAYAFQESVVSTLIQKCVDACKKFKASTLLIGGGVAANGLLRKKLDQIKKDHHINIYYPPMSLCIDNAAMIAGLGYHNLN